MILILLLNLIKRQNDFYRHLPEGIHQGIDKKVIFCFSYVINVINRMKIIVQFRGLNNELNIIYIQAYLANMAD